MSKRNFILLIIILIIITVVALGFFYFYQPEDTTSGGEGTNFLSQFNPFGNTTTEPPPGTETPVYDLSPTSEPGTEILASLKRISSMPVAGYGIFKKERFKEVPIVTPQVAQEGESLLETIAPKPTPPETEFVTALRYVARASGNIHQTFADKIDERKFSSTVIPRVHEAYFGNKGESVVMRYLKTDDITIETFVGNIPKEVLGADTTGDNEVKGSFLPANIKDVSISPDNLKLFYLLNVGDNIVGTTSGLLDNRKVQIFDSPFTEWLSWWPRSGVITLTTKPSAGVPGYMYAVDPNIKKLNKILGGVNGLTTLASPDGKLVIYGSNDLSLNIYDIATKSSDILGVRTLPEKCVWDKTSSIVYCAVPKQPEGVMYPDSWYKGEVSFRDEIWKIDIKSGNTTMLLDPILTAGGEEIDGMKLGLDEEENYLFFVNKKDSYLWELKLQ